MTGRRVFVSAVGQDDNIGDSVLRRAYLDALREAGELHVLAAGCSRDYRTGLGIRPGDTVYDERGDWWHAAGQSIEESPVVVAFNAGEMQLNAMFAKSYARHAALIARAKRSGGFGVHAGMGIRRKTGLGLPIGALLRLCRVVTWRDQASRDWTRVGRVVPDWAFALSSTAAHGVSRDILAVSLRGDRATPTPSWLDSVERVASWRGLTPTLVVQVERDNELAATIGRARGWAVAGWNGGAHAVRETEVRELYARSAAVISDRLHALVIGATEGATPVAFSSASTEKARRTLAAAGLGRFAVSVSDNGSPDAARHVHELLDTGADVATAVAGARRELESLSAEFRA